MFYVIFQTRVRVLYRGFQTLENNNSPQHNSVDKPAMITWEIKSNGSLIVLPTTIISDAYNEIVTWRKNVFLVLYGKIGREFIDQVTLHITIGTAAPTISTYH